ncbi:hypothetical protein [Hymenobacter glacieicola]|uniref:Uncharacterized protein n=1 Tax=Hymenobacter glacieicola TaxID=1562124 RepID=A0ABQ1WZM8_9BACT|nr:hypothetical protein [Hymenobacter glacieicola]GGG51766.1 hypothetical protein GCM10011378_29970 [Hymenobacter glacieicola]
MMKLVVATWLTSLLLLTGPDAWACRVCRPRVQAGIHTADYTANLLLLLLPVAVVLLVGVGVFFAPALKARLTSPSAHD